MKRLPPIESTLLAMGACSRPGQAVPWAAPYGRDWRRAWEECVRPDWMFWLLWKLGIDLHWVVMAGAWCAVPPLKYVPRKERRPHNAVWAAVQWALGEIGDEELHDAYSDAKNAHKYARNGAWSAAITVARAAACKAASTTATEAAWAAICAAKANVLGDSWEVARDESLAHSCNCIRAVVPWEMVEEAIRRGA